MLKRNMGDQLLNICSLGLSEINGYNTNVQVGDIRHIFYKTLYGSKSTQKDDTRGYIAVRNAISNHILKQEKEMELEGEKWKNRHLTLVKEFQEYYLQYLLMLMQILSVRLCHTLLIQLDQGSYFHMKEHYCYLLKWRTICMEIILVLHLEQKRMKRPNFGQIHRSTI